jgi:uncharacterized protein (TIGR03067 family)
MFPSKIKIVAGILFLVGAMSAGIWLLGTGGPAIQGQEPKQSSGLAAAKNAPKEPKKGGPKGDAALAADLKALEGTWVVTAAQIEGRKATKEELANGMMAFEYIDPADPTAKTRCEFAIVNEVVFKRDKVVMKAGGRRPELKFVLYPDKTPKAIDIPFTAKTVTKLACGMDKEGTVELVRLGIYKVEGDRLTICLTDGGDTNPPSPRPKEFDTRGKERWELYTFRRKPPR